MSSHKPYLLFCPYLPLKKPIDFAEWVVGAPSQHEEVWQDPAFEKQAKAFLAKFQDADGKPIASPAIIGNAKRGIDGTFPGPRQFEALQLALHFAALESNPPWEPEADGAFALTTDNSELWAQPIDLEGGYVTIQRGSLLRVLSGGRRITDERFVIRAPLELHMPVSAINLDAEVLEAIYLIALRDDPLAKRVSTAIRWLAKAWQNSASIGWEDRVVMLRTAFEALTGSSDVEVAPQTLEGFFGRLRDAGEAADSTTHLIWSPSETAQRDFTYTTRAGKVRKLKLTDLGHWYSTFGQARHLVVHEGQIPNLLYEETGSRYNGPIFNIGERVLREAIKVALFQLAYPDIWQDAFHRSVVQHVERVQANAP